ncbi:MAG: hypothetical protein AUJ85_09845 [Elusimicrobia bacterium CG1_02_37_114]|nr:MAG: hypothetical protein AUJ85_09845 [Elusimicrobia bacterium CG1_02_37_114]PIV54064.1 MAG: hypothetical protein COS17_00570 [Elusimicrobia bacterium CG02_land_8_20_14_3_00_37_13]PIZ12611.1 MAG: hypothetical protein COY53_09155 [Elusimicrobia bacterium CG_4_10_14_0_8_um_filter_37_32]
MNIAYLDASPCWSGGSKQVYLLSRELTKRGHNVLTVCLSQNKELLSQLQKNNLKAIPLFPVFEFNPLNFFRLSKVFRENKVQIVDINSPKFFWSGVYSAKCSGIKTVITRIVTYRKKGLKKFINKRLLYGLCDKVVAISSEIKASLLGDFGLSNVELIYCGIDINEISSEDKNRTESIRNRYGLKDKTVVGITGRIAYGKGHTYLIEALPEIKKNIPDIKLLVGGTGEQNFINFLRRKSSELKIERDVIFTGFQKDVKDFLYATDIVTAPSLDEALGLSIIEAMSAGKPVVASDVGGIPEIIDNGIDGFLVPPSDSKTLAASIVKLLKSDYKKMGETGKKKVLEKFSVEQMVNKYEMLYRSIV